MAVPFRKKSSTRIKKGYGPKSFKLFKRFNNLFSSLRACKQCGKIRRIHFLCNFCLNKDEKQQN